jgi:hypothetical protein
MKAFFLTLFFFILVAFSVLAGIIVAQIPPRSWSLENTANHAFDLAEKGASQISELTSGKVDEWLAEKFGQCQPMTLPKATGVDPIGNISPVAGVTPFSRTLSLAANSLLCGFPGRGKSILFIPQEPGKVILRRRPYVPGSMEYAGEEKSKLLLISDELDFNVLVPGTLLHLQSKGATSVLLEYMKGESKLSVLVLNGDLEFSVSPLTNVSMPTLISLSLMNSSSLSSQGKLFPTRTTVNILPSGVYVGSATTPVPGISVVSPFLISSLFSVPLANDPGTPQLSSIDALKTALYDVTSRESILSLATNFPALFPIRFLCGFTAPKAKLVAVLPGEWINAPEGGTLECPGGYSVLLEKGTRMRVRQADSLPDFTLASGSIGVTSGAADYFFSLPGFSGGLRGQTKYQNIIYSAKPLESLLACTEGLATVSIRSSNQPNVKSLLSSRACRLDVYFGQKGEARHLFPVDNVHVENLGISRISWPYISPSPQLNRVLLSSKFIHLELKAQPGGALSWQLPPSLLNADCTVISQKSDFAPLIELAKLKGTAMGEAQVDPANIPGFAALLCLKEGITAFSSLVAIWPKAPPEPPAAK